MTDFMKKSRVIIFKQWEIINFSLIPQFIVGDINRSFDFLI